MKLLPTLSIVLFVTGNILLQGYHNTLSRLGILIVCISVVVQLTKWLLSKTSSIKKEQYPDYPETALFI